MKQRDIFIFFYQVLTGAVCIALTNAFRYSVHPIENVLIIILSLTCLLGFHLLLNLFNILPRLRLPLLAAAFITALCFDKGMYPFCCLLLSSVCGRVTADRKTSVILCAVLIFCYYSAVVNVIRIGIK